MRKRHLALGIVCMLVIGLGRSPLRPVAASGVARIQRVSWTGSGPGASTRSWWSSRPGPI